MRGLAILVVILVHLNIRWLAPGGFIGVDLFFVLSGFLICTLLLQEYSRSGEINYFQFAVRRISRIFPAHAVLILVLLVYALTHLSGQGAHAFLQAAPASITYTFNYVYAAIFKVRDTPVNHTWSLAVEMQAYLLVAVALYVATKHNRPGRRLIRWLAVVAVLVAIWRAIETARFSDPTPLYVRTDTRIDTIALGALAACLCHEYPELLASSQRWLGKVGLTAFLAYIAMAATVPPLSRFMYVWGFAVVAVCAVLFITAAVEADAAAAIRRLFRYRRLRQLGDISYSLYLWHFPVYYFVAPRLVAPLPIVVTTKILLSTVVAVGSRRWIEKPALALTRRRFLARQTVTATVLHARAEALPTQTRTR